MPESLNTPLRIEEVAGPDVLTDALRFRRSMEIDTVGILLFTPDGQILRANDAFLRMSGYSQEDVRAGKVRWTELTPPEWLPASRLALEQFITLGAALPYEKQYFRKDGSRFWVFIASKKLSENEGIAFVLDITERKEAEAHLQETQLQLERSDSQLQTITDAVPALIAYVDPKLRYIRVNRHYANFFETEPDKLIGRPMHEVLGAAFAEINPHLQRALRGEAQQFEVTLPSGASGLRHMFSQHMPDLSPEGHVLGIVIQSQDMTDRRHTEEMLRTAEKLAAVGRLAASMAHEINNPLEAVTNLLYLARTSEDPESTSTFLEQAEGELRRVAAITNQTLRFHKQSTRPVAAQARQLFDSVVTIYGRQLQNCGMTVEQRVRADSAVVCFDGEIRQVLSNLMSNALDATSGRDARLLLRACLCTDWPTGRRGVRLTVADTGTGMSKDVLNRAWEPFFTTKEVGGTGLGLWISRDITERHAGTLRVRSRVGRGTVFTLWLPLDPVVR